MPKKKTKKISIEKSIAGETRPAAAKNSEHKSVFLLALYWILIVLVVFGACVAAFYKRNGGGNVQVTESSAPTEEPLTAGTEDLSADYREAGKEKLLSGDTVGALNDFTIAIERNPAEPLNYIYRGEVLMSGSNYDAAIGDFDNAARLDPTAVVAYYDRALAYIKLERLDAAKTDLDSAIEAMSAERTTSGLFIPIHDIHAKRAQVNLWLRNWDNATTDYTAAIAENTGESDWNDFTGRAEARTNMGDFNGAIADYVSAVTIISERIQKTPDEKTREDMSRQAMGYFEKSGALRVKAGQMDLALQDLQAAHTLALALDDTENQNRLQILMNSIRK